MSEKVIYTCCVRVSGLTSDPQELPLLYCPECREEMTAHVFYQRDGGWYAIEDGEWVPENDAFAFDTTGEEK